MDFKDRTMNAESWLLGFMEREIDCVAVTDHNSGEWIDELQKELKNLKEKRPEGYRRLTLFPGVEISANGGVHILAIFDPEKTGSDIDTLLGAVGYQGTKGKSDGVTKKSLTEIVDLIVQGEGIAIPAHVNKAKGLFGAVEGQSLVQILKNRNIHAMELCDREFSKPELYKTNKTDWTEVCGSDFHGESSNAFTWVKMGKPSIEGLRLALIDGAASVNLDTDAEPNRHAEYVIEEIIVKGAKYMGRPEALECSFSPFLNSIIGGRGSGKSSLMEFIRLAVRRTHELPERLLKDSNQSYFSTDETGGLLTQDSQLHVIYRKGDTRYRLNWNANSTPPSLEEWVDVTERWLEVEGEIVSLFPVRIFSQKQIFELASEPQGLLGVIDRTPEVKFESYQRDFQDCVSTCKQLIQLRTQIEQKIRQENKLKGQLNELKRQIGKVEESGHKVALQQYRLRQRQQSEISHFEQHWISLSEDLLAAVSVVEPIDVNQDIFTKHPEILTALQDKQEQWQQQIVEMRKIAEKQAEDLRRWSTEKQGQAWAEALNQDLRQYELLRFELELQDVDPQTYPTLLKEYSAVEKELQQITDLRKQTRELTDQYWKTYADAKSHRTELTNRRKKFLERILEGNQSVRITVEPFDEPWEGVEKRIREILQAEDRFDKDIEAIKDAFYVHGWEKIHENVFNIRTGKENARDARFQNHLQGLPTESLVDMRLWFPNDALKVTYGANNKTVQEGSPGQKSAALLTFILAHGDEPLMLDQPEDDLDNELIYRLIVQALRDTKTKRQIIVVTHNANIVVNGDSEMVHCLMVANGQSHLESGSLQSESVRQRICDTLEGGSKAFEQRYKRIHLEN